MREIVARAATRPRLFRQTCPVTELDPVMIRTTGLGRRFGSVWAIRDMIVSAIDLRIGVALFDREAILTRWR